MNRPIKLDGAADMKEHEIALTVNRLCDIAKEYGQTQQLRERIAAVVVPLLSASKPAVPAQSVKALNETQRRAIYFAIGYIGNAPGNEQEVTALRSIAESQSVVVLDDGRPADIEPAAYLVRGLDGYNEEYASVWIKHGNADAAAATIFRASITPLVEARTASQQAALQGDGRGVALPAFDQSEKSGSPVTD